MRRGSVLFFYIVMILWAHSAHGQGEPRLDAQQQDFVLVGNVIESDLEADGANIFVRLKVRFDLRNVGPICLMFHKQDKPTFVGLALSKTPYFAPDDLIEKYYGGPSIDDPEVWKQMRLQLDLDVPSAKVIRSLEPNETWSFVQDISIVTTKKVSLQRQLTFSHLRDLSPVWIKVFFEVWSGNIEPNVEQRSEMVFGKALRKRWSNYGRLLLDDIVSSAMPLDLRNAAVREPSRP